MSLRPRPDTSLSYRQLWEDFWASAEWTGLPAGPPSPRLLLLFLAVGPVQRAVPGVLLTGPGEIADRLGWSSADVQACLQQLEEVGAVRTDLAARLIWLPWKYHHEEPANPDVVRGSTWRAVFERWPRGELAAEVHAFLRAELVKRGPAYADAFDTLPCHPTVSPHGVPPRSPDTVPPHGGGGDGGTPTNQRIKESKDTASAEKPPPPSGGEQPVNARAKATRKKNPPTAEQAEERRQVRAYWDAGFRKRCPTEKPLEWGAEKGKRHELVIGLLRLCGGAEGAVAHLDRYFARYDSDAFWRSKGLRWDVAASAGCVEESRSAHPAAAGAANGRAAPGPNYPTAEESTARMRAALAESS